MYWHSPSPLPLQVAGGTQAAKQEKIEMLTKKINDLVEKVEALLIRENGFHAVTTVWSLL